MKLRVYSVSGPSWQIIKNGKPYNKWVGVIQYTDVNHTVFGRRYYTTISGFTKGEVESKLTIFHIGDVVSIPAKNVCCLNIGGINANAE